MREDLLFDRLTSVGVERDTEVGGYEAILQRKLGFPSETMRVPSILGRRYAMTKTLC